MQAAHPLNEVAWTKDRDTVADTESDARSYAPWEGQPLESSYYIACWPEATKVPYRLHDDPAFVGPFASRREAEMALAGIAICGL